MDRTRGIGGSDIAAIMDALLNTLKRIISLYLMMFMLMVTTH